MTKDGKFWEQNHDETTGAVDSLLMGARVQAAKREVTARTILEEMLERKKQELEKETTSMGVHETTNWIKWVEIALKVLGEDSQE